MTGEPVRLIVVDPGNGVDLAASCPGTAVVAEVVPAVAATGSDASGDRVVTADPGSSLDRRMAAVRADRRHPFRLAFEAVRRGRGDAVVCWGDPELLAAVATFAVGSSRGAPRPLLAAVPLDGATSLLCDTSPGSDPVLSHGADALLTTAALASAAAAALGVVAPPHLLVAGDPCSVPGAVHDIRGTGRDLGVAPVATWARGRDEVPVALCTAAVGAALADVVLPRSCRVVLGVAAVAVAGPVDPGPADVEGSLGLAADLCRGSLLDRSAAALDVVVRIRRAAASASTGTDPPSGGRIEP